MTMDEIEFAQDRVSKARKVLQVLEQKKFEREELPRRRGMVGKYFKYHNSYGTDRPKWWLLIKVEALDKDGDFILSEIQIDCAGVLTIKENQWSMHGSLTVNYQEATKREWDAKVKEASAILNRIS